MVWAAARAGDEPQSVPLSNEDNDDLDVGGELVGSLDATLVEALLDRVFASADFERLVDLAAGLIWPRFQAITTTRTLPMALDEAGFEDPGPVREAAAACRRGQIRCRA